MHFFLLPFRPLIPPTPTITTLSSMSMSPFKFSLNPSSISKNALKKERKKQQQQQQFRLVWLSGLSTGLQTKGSPVQVPVRAHAWVVGQVPSWGCTRGNHTLIFLSLSFSLPSPLKINKYIFLKKGLDSMLLILNRYLGLLWFQV